MLGLVISTIAFSVAAYALNRYFDAGENDSTRSRKVLVMTAATLISIGAGWVTDQLDGDAVAARKNGSIIDIVQSGDPVQIAKVLIGIN
jgi:hypothetical protein